MVEDRHNADLGGSLGVSVPVAAECSEIEEDRGLDTTPCVVATRRRVDFGISATLLLLSVCFLCSSGLEERRILR